MLAGIFCLMLWLFSARVAHAQMASSATYNLEVAEMFGEGEGLEEENIPPGGVNASTSSAHPGNSTEYLNELAEIYQGFPNTASASSILRLNLDQTKVNFGSLTPGFHARRQTQVQISSDLPVGYQLFVSQSQPLTLLQNYQAGLASQGERDSIPGTTCDDGNCNPNVAGEWQNESVAGFGYSVSGADSVADFAQGTKYRPFPIVENDMEASLIASAVNSGVNLNNREIVVEYQMGIPAPTEAGIYVTRINYTLVPNF